jgi:predicted membrane channel-forming protein YqfA (hemolysin III family)
MCGTIEFIAFDGLIIVGVILLVVWILALCGIVTIGKKRKKRCHPSSLALHFQ